MFKDEGPKLEGPNPCTYFGLGRTEIDENTGNKFDRQRRMLPGDIAMLKPDNNNTLFQKDKGRGVRKEIKGNMF